MTLHHHPFLNSVSTGRFSFLIFTMALSFFIASKSHSSEQKNWYKELQRQFGEELLEGEQLGSAFLPTFANITTLPEVFNKDFSIVGRLPTEYQPATQTAFALTSLWLPESASKVYLGPRMSNRLKQVFVSKRNGQNFFRFLIHPLEKERYTDLLKKYDEDRSVLWYGTPSASPRSLYIWSPQAPDLKLMAKLSLGMKIGANSRIIGEEKIERAITMTPLIQAASTSNKGKMFLPETLGVIPRQTELGGMIIREWNLPNPDRTIALPWLALAARIPSKKPWTQRLFAASKSTDKVGFVWEKLALPLVDIYVKLSMDHGITSELHQQNVVLLIDRENLIPVGLGYKDADGYWLDYTLRTHRLGFPPFRRKSFEEDAQLLYYEGSMKNHVMSYFRFVRAESLIRISKELA